MKLSGSKTVLYANIITMRHSEAEKEFEDAIAENGGIIAKVCYYFSSDAEEFKDLRQEVLYNIWRGWGRFRKDSKVSTWIYRISFNTCVSFQRKEKHHKSAISIDSLLDYPVEEEISKLEKYNKMHEMIARLSYEERAIILLWLDENSYDEIADIMGLNRNTVAVKIMRIKEKLIKNSQGYERN